MRPFVATGRRGPLLPNDNSDRDTNTLIEHRKVHAYHALPSKDDITYPKLLARLKRRVIALMPRLSRNDHRDSRALNWFLEQVLSQDWTGPIDDSAVYADKTVVNLLDPTDPPVQYKKIGRFK